MSALDTDGDGEVSKEEMKAGLQGVSEANAIRVVKFKKDFLIAHAEVEKAEVLEKEVTNSVFVLILLVLFDKKYKSTY